MVNDKCLPVQSAIYRAQGTQRTRRRLYLSSLHGAEGAVQSLGGQELHTARRISLRLLSAIPRRFHASGARTPHGMTLWK